MGQAMRRAIPTVATIANLGAGFLAIALAVEGKQDLAALVIVAAVLCDSLDGAMARMFNVSCEFGAELDSLADMVSFGVAPAVVVGTMIPDFRFVMWLILAVYPVCAAVRLARFNVSRLESPAQAGFEGLPSTGAGGCVAAIVLVHETLGNHWPVVSACLLLVLAALMVTNVPYPHVGSLITRFPVAAVVAGAALVLVGAVYGRYEPVFIVFFWGYALWGPTLAVREKIRSVREAHSG